MNRCDEHDLFGLAAGFVALAVVDRSASVGELDPLVEVLLVTNFKAAADLVGLALVIAETEVALEIALLDAGEGGDGGLVGGLVGGGRWSCW